MLGTIVNTCSIIIGSALGAFNKKVLKKETQEALVSAIGLCASCLGISTFSAGISKSHYPVMFIISLFIGTYIGTILKLDEKFNNITSKIGSDDFSKGLQSAVLLFCIGTLSILGPVESALYGNNTFLFTNAALDFISSIIFSSVYGFKIAYAAIVLFLWQGSIYLLSLFLGNLISINFFNELSTVGGILILSSGLSILKIKELKTMNMLPSLLVSAILWAIIHFLH